MWDGVSCSDPPGQGWDRQHWWPWVIRGPQDSQSRGRTSKLTLSTQDPEAAVDGLAGQAWNRTAAQAPAPGFSAPEMSSPTCGHQVRVPPRQLWPRLPGQALLGSFSTSSFSTSSTVLISLASKTFQSLSFKFVYVCMHACVCVHVSVSVCALIYVCIYVCVYLSVSVWIYAWVCVRARSVYAGTRLLVGRLLIEVSGANPQTHHFWAEFHGPDQRELNSRTEHHPAPRGPAPGSTGHSQSLHHFLECPINGVHHAACSLLVMAWTILKRVSIAHRGYKCVLGSTCIQPDFQETRTARPPGCSDGKVWALHMDPESHHL